MSTLVGIQLNGRYRLEAQIGAGGMSTVYRAIDTVLERSVAVKIMHREFAHDSDQLERFRREARAVAQLSHAHIVTVIDAGEDAGHPYIVFEYVDGETLKERIRRLGRLPVDQALAYTIEIARALRCAHQRGIVHRDIKPQNVLIDSEGSAKVTDFGIARSLDEEGLTVDGRVLGTTDYVSPEQALGQVVNGQTDIYSLGVVLYEMLTGDVPFHAENQVAVAMKHVREDLPDVRERRPEVSATVARVIDRMTATELAVRYPDSDALIADLEEALALEAARTRQSTGEATAVLRTLSEPAKKRLPLRMRWHPPVVASLLVGLLSIGVLGFAAKELIDRTERGTGKGNLEETKDRKIVSVKRGSAKAYDPFGDDGREHDEEAFRAVDRVPGTVWKTEGYSGNTLNNKPGVGIYVDAVPGVEAVEAVIRTPVPDWKAEIYGARGPLPEAGEGRSIKAAGWKKLAGGTVKAKQTIFPLRPTARYRYYLVWITALPPNDPRVQIDEIGLRKVA
ncbi:MAG: protein kinase [Actinomycetota bacterium]|nr:protein kinase [Actinomycetota bacterium]